MAESQSTLPFGNRQSSLKSGIYQIHCTSTGKLYVGSAVNIKVRWKAHVNGLLANRHHSSLLQRAWNKYGRRDFVFEVIEWVEPERLIEREQFHIDAKRSADRRHGFNVSPTAGSTRGVIPNEETRQKMSEAAKRARTPEMRSAISMTLKGRPLTPEWRAKVVAAGSGRLLTAEHRAKVSAACKGIPRSEETKRKVSESLIGHPCSEETRQKLREAWVRRKQRSSNAG